MNTIRALLLSLCLCTANGIFALEQEDRGAIEAVIQGYIDAWNLHECKGFGDGFSEDADFVNIFGMHFKTRSEIESRHLKILQSFLKGSIFTVLDLQLREAQPGLVIAIVHWQLDGYRDPKSDMNLPGDTREGIFTQVFVKSNHIWEITASQNTLMPKK